MGADAATTVAEELAKTRYQRPDGKFVEVLLRQKAGVWQTSRATAALFLGAGNVRVSTTSPRFVPCNLDETQSWALFATDPTVSYDNVVLTVPEESPIHINMQRGLVKTGPQVRSTLLGSQYVSTLRIRVLKDHPWKYCSVYRLEGNSLDDKYEMALFMRGNAYESLPAVVPHVEIPDVLANVPAVPRKRWPVVDTSNQEPYIAKYWVKTDPTEQWAVAKRKAPVTLGLFAARAEACQLMYERDFQDECEASCAAVDAKREVVDAKLRYHLCCTELIRAQEEDHADWVAKQRADNDAWDVTERQLRETIAGAYIETERVNKLAHDEITKLQDQLHATTFCGGVNIDRMRELEATVKELRDNVAIAEREQMLKTAEIKKLTTEKEDAKTLANMEFTRYTKASQELSQAKQTIDRQKHDYGLLEKEYNMATKDLADARAGRDMALRECDRMESEFAHRNAHRNKENIPPSVKSVQNAVWPGCNGHPQEKTTTALSEPVIPFLPTHETQLAVVASFIRTLSEVLEAQTKPTPPPQ